MKKVIFATIFSLAQAADAESMAKLMQFGRGVGQFQRTFPEVTNPAERDQE